MAGRERSRRVNTWGVCSDIHIPHVHEPTLAAFLEWVTDRRPHGVVVLGDFLDLESLSRFPEDPRGELQCHPSIRRFVELVTAFRQLVDRVVIVEGNHEDRLYKSMLPLLRKLDGFVGLTLREQCEFAGLARIDGWQWIVEGPDGAALEIGTCLLRHGHRQAGRFGAKHVAHGLLAKSLGAQSELVGHYHTAQLHTHPVRGRAPVWGAVNPCMEVDAAFAGRPWVRGWTILEHDTVTGAVAPYPVLCHDGVALVGGRAYGVAETERPPSRRTMTGPVTIRGQTRTLPEWCELYGRAQRTVYSRIKRGWDPLRALEEPPDERMRALGASQR